MYVKFSNYTFCYFTDADIIIIPLIDLHLVVVIPVVIFLPWYFIATYPYPFVYPTYLQPYLPAQLPATFTPPFVILLPHGSFALFSWCRRTFGSFAHAFPWCSMLIFPHRASFFSHSCTWDLFLFSCRAFSSFSHFSFFCTVVHSCHIPAVRSSWTSADRVPTIHAVLLPCVPPPHSFSLPFATARAPQLSRVAHRRPHDTTTRFCPAAGLFTHGAATAAALHLHVSPRRRAARAAFGRYTTTRRDVLLRARAACLTFPQFRAAVRLSCRRMDGR